MLGPPKLRLLDQPATVSLEDLVPADNFSRFLDAKLDLSFIRTWVQDCYAERGRPSIDPVVFVKLQLVLFFEGLRSERKLVETAALHLAHRWHLGYRLDEPLPDHSSLTRIRTRLGLPILWRFFEHSVELCQQAGLVWGRELFFDGTKVRANADIDSLAPRFYLHAKQQAAAHVEERFAADGTIAEAVTDPVPTSDAPAPPRGAGAPLAPRGNEVAGAQVSVPPPLPFRSPPAEERRLAAEHQAGWKLLDEYRLDPTRPPSGSYRRIVDFRASTTTRVLRLITARFFNTLAPFRYGTARFRAWGIAPCATESHKSSQNQCLAGHDQRRLLKRAVSWSC